jgi:hypothetical protein
MILSICNLVKRSKGEFAGGMKNQYGDWTDAQIFVLAEHEGTISRGLAQFVEVGTALQEIKQDGLYLIDGYKSFVDYLSIRWPRLHKSHAYRLMDAADTYRNLARLSPMGDTLQSPQILPESERQCRELHGLPAPEQREVWQDAVTRAGGKQPTGAIMGQSIAALFGEEEHGEGQIKAENIRRPGAHKPFGYVDLTTVRYDPATQRLHMTFVRPAVTTNNLREVRIEGYIPLDTVLAVIPDVRPVPASEIADLFAASNIGSL